VTAIIRPERIALTAAAGAGALPGRITAISYLGASFEAQVEAEDTVLQVSVPNDTLAFATRPAVGDAVRFTIPPDAITLGT